MPLAHFLLFCRDVSWLCGTIIVVENFALSLVNSHLGLAYAFGVEIAGGSVLRTVTQCQTNGPTCNLDATGVAGSGRRASEVPYLSPGFRVELSTG